MAMSPGPPRPVNPAAKQLDALEAIAERGESLRSPAETSKRESPSGGDAFLSELRRDLKTYRQERSQAASSPSDQHLYVLLGELQRDIEALRRAQHEQSHSILPSPEQQLYGLLAELRRDIDMLHSVQPVWTPPSKESDLRNMLAELRHDIVALRKLETDPLGRAGSVDELRRAFAVGGGAQGAWSERRMLMVGLPIGIASGVAVGFGLLVLSGEITIGRGAGPGYGQALGTPGLATSRNDASGLAGQTLKASADQLVESARTLIKKGDITFARRVLENAKSQGSASAVLMLAETYDPQVLAELYNPAGAAADISTARKLYEIAARAGNQEAASRLVALGRSER